MLIAVTQGDINNGVPKSICHCPVALAMKNSGFAYAVIGGDTGYAGYTLDDKFYLEFPPAVANFVKKFDASLPVEPFTFEAYETKL